MFPEIKVNVEKANLIELKKKSGTLLDKYNDYKVEYLLLGMQNLGKYI